jgi:hypothetical protein
MNMIARKMREATVILMKSKLEMQPFELLPISQITTIG